MINAKLFIKMYKSGLFDVNGVILCFLGVRISYGEKNYMVEISYSVLVKLLYFTTPKNPTVTLLQFLKVTTYS